MRSTRWWNSSRCDESCAVQAHAGEISQRRRIADREARAELSQRDIFHLCFHL
jgi:hypothetical protein